MRKYKYKTAVYIGRFQPFHLAHLDTIKLALDEAETLIVAVGSCNKPITVKNPWTAQERIQMIKYAVVADRHTGWTDKFHDDINPHRIKYIEIRDYMYNDAKWAAEVFAKATQIGATDDKETALYGCFKDDGSYFLKMYPQWDLRETEYLYNLNATDVRECLFEKENLDTYETLLPNHIHRQMMLFLCTERFKTLKAEHEHYKAYKAQFASMPFPPTFVTVDSLVVKSGHVLLVERGRNPGKGLLALPGGFLDQNERLDDAAIRELKEETNIKVDAAVLKNAIDTVKVFDHPKRSLRGRMITHAHLIDLGSTGQLPMVKAGDDASKAMWVPLADVLSSERKFFDDHYCIITHLTSRF
jgi:bifunctional NMN adenylyltransferase/nudix hydrolase